MKLSLSPRAMAAAIVTCAVAAFAPACAVPPPPVPPSTEVAQVSVEPGAPMTSVPGSGVGLFVQYDAGGHWRLTTTCDTSITGASCTFDVTISPAAGVTIANVKGVGLQPTDTVVRGADGAITLVTQTTLGSDGISFDADPGAAIRVEMLLDGVSQPGDIYVVGLGGLLRGVPTNPVDLRPSAP